MSHVLRRATDFLRSNFFVLPALAVVIGFVGARLAVGVDVGSWVGESTVDSARAVLSTVAAATITFASITFSVALLIMQQGSQQFSPRVIPGLTRDPFHRRVIAVVVGTFTYCLVVLQRVRSPLDDDGDPIVPNFAVALGLVLGLLAVLAVVAAIHHTAQQMDVSKILAGIVTEATRTLVEPPAGLDSTDDAEPPLAATSTAIRFEGTGWVRQTDLHALISLAPPAGTVRLETAPGRYVIPGTIAVTIWPAVDEDDLADAVERTRGAITLGATRTMTDDPGYGLRQLVDVALKALSPGVNDPTTAQDAIFHLGTVLALNLDGPPHAAAYRDDDDRRLLLPQALTDADLAQLAIGELRLAAAPLPTVSIYLLEMIDDVVESVGRTSRRVAPLLDQARLLLLDAEHAGLAAHELAAVRDAYDRRFGGRPADVHVAAPDGARRAGGGDRTGP